MKTAALAALLALLLPAGSCRQHPKTLGTFEHRIAPIYSQYARLSREREEVVAKGDREREEALDLEQERLLPQLNDSLATAMAKEKGREIPFTQGSVSHQGFTVRRIRFTGAEISGSPGELILHFEAEAELHSSDARWKSGAWKFVGGDGSIRGEGDFFEPDEAATGQVIFYGSAYHFDAIRDFERILIP